MVASGAEAKLVIEQGQVQVNGKVETQKRKKMRCGDIIEFAGETLRLRLVSSND
jgi:ribosome-associated protein